MAKRARKVKKQSRRSGAQPARPLAPPAELGDTQAFATTAAASPVPLRAAPTPPRPGRASAKRQEMTLPPEVSSIPLQQVPYFIPDLRRIGITAGAMLLLIAAAAFVIPLLTK